jgi:hypothetical protein
MSGYVEKFEESRKEREGLRTIPAAFADQYPALALCMGGILKEGSADIRVSSSSVTLFWEGGQLKFSVSPRFDNRVGFGIVADPLQALASIDRALSEGQIGWKIGRNKRTA